MKKVGGARGILWDFDGTLARRTGFWSDLLVEALDLEVDDHGYAAVQFREAMRRGFPWHDWERVHPELAAPDAWWAAITRLLRSALLDAGLDPAVAARAADRARAEYLRLERWRLFPDTVATLDRLRAEGWRHAILSNHCPELPDLVEGLGIADRFEAIVNSATTSYEKPHPEAFALGRAALGDPDVLWMVGDNPIADIEGAQRAGIPAILVRTAAEEGAPAVDLAAVLDRLSADADQCGAA